MVNQQQSNLDIDIELQQAMAQVLSSVFFDKPNASLIGQFIESEIAQFPTSESANYPQLQGYLTQWQTASEAQKAALLLELSVDYAQLFIGPSTPKAPPWGSIYLCATRQMNGHSTFALTGFYSTNGIRLTPEANQPADHIGLFLVVIEGLLGQLGRAPNDERAKRLLAELLSDHLMPWVDQWAALVIKHANTDYYRGFAKLILDYLKDLQNTFCVR